MQFVKVTHSVLRELKKQGYNVLKSVNTVADDSPTFTPIYVSDLWNYLESLDSEDAAVVIDDALENIRDEDLVGMVWI